MGVLLNSKLQKLSENLQKFHSTQEKRGIENERENYLLR